MVPKRLSFCRAGACCYRLFLVLLLQLAIVCPTMALEVPALRGRVNDYGGLIAPATMVQLEQSLQYLEETDSTQIVILTVASLAGDSLEDFSLRVAETWQIGKAGRDNGVLLLVAVEDRKVRIEVGYGLEGVLTDLVAGRIIRGTILPRFKEGNFDQGIVDGVTAISQAVKGEFVSTDDAAKKTDDPAALITMLIFFFFLASNIFTGKPLASAAACGFGAPLIGTILKGFSLPLTIALVPIGLFAGFVINKMQVVKGRENRSSPWGSTGGFGGGSSRSSGGFGGGFSGGGGGFGGGGASGGW